jgi:hypothetical protein
MIHQAHPWMHPYHRVHLRGNSSKRQKTPTSLREKRQQQGANTTQGSKQREENIDSTIAEPTAISTTPDITAAEPTAEPAAEPDTTPLGSCRRRN